MTDVAANGNDGADRPIPVAAITRHAAAAFPPTETVERDGWLLRATPGLARGRLNSALPLAPHPPLATVTGFYAERAIAPQVQLLTTRPDLGAELDALGWGAKWPTAVLVRESTGPSALIPADEAGIGTLGEDVGDVEFLDAPTPHWLAAWARAEARDPATVEQHRAHVFSRLPRPAAFALAADDAAAGVVVAHRQGHGHGLAGVFSVAVDPARRRGGRGTHLMLRLLAWAHAQGVRTVYLEVERRNAPALALYAGLGFTERYGYVHRTGPPAGPPGQDRPALGDGSH